MTFGTAMVRALSREVQGPDCGAFKSTPRLNWRALPVEVPSRSVARGLALSASCIAETAAICLPTIVESMRGTLTARASDQRLERWAARVLQHAGVELDVDGALPHGGPFVVMSNHASFLDIPVVYRLFGGRLRMVAKKELFRVPVFGRAMLDAGFVRVDRENHGEAIRSFDRARDAMHDGTSIWLAPEGTRGNGSALGPLKKGGFMLALQTGCPILPLTLRGTARVLPRGALALRDAARVGVTIHAPIPVAELPRDDADALRVSRDQLMQRVAGCIGAAL